MKHPEDSDPTTGGQVARRTFLAGAAATAGFTIVPRHVLGGQGTPAPSEKLNIAGVGVGGMGKSNVGKSASREHRGPVRRGLRAGGRDASRSTRAPSGTRTSARCSTSRRTSTRSSSRRPTTRTPSSPWRPWSAASTSTAEAADPLRLRGPAPDRGRPQAEGGHADGQPGPLRREGIRLLCEWIWDGAIGPVREVHAWTEPAGLAAGHRGRPAHGHRARAGRRSTGTCGSARPRTGPTTRPITPPSGAAGGTSAPGRWATWAATSWTRSSGP